MKLDIDKTEKKIEKTISETECYSYIDYNQTEALRLRQFTKSQLKVKQHLDNLILNKDNFLIFESKMNNL